jgi:monoamine oxidase
MTLGSEGSMDNEYDVIIIDAGISGINTAYKLQTQLPSHSYTILEARERHRRDLGFVSLPRHSIRLDL